MSKCDHDSREWHSHGLEIINLQLQILTRYQVVANLDHIYFLKNHLITAYFIGI